MEESQEIPEKSKRGRPRKEETAIAEPEDDPPFQPVKKRTRKKPDPETAIQSDVAFTSKKGEVSFKAMRAPPKPKLERATAVPHPPSRPYAQLHDRFSPYGHFTIA